MKNKKRIITLILISILLIIVLGVFIYMKNKNNNILINGENSQINVGNNEKGKVIFNSIDMEKDDLYEVEKEYDGREIQQVKSNVQFNIVLAGILKNEQPQEEEILELLKKSPDKCGIWVSGQSRDNFMKLLEENNLNQFEIDNDGYLMIKDNSNDEKFMKIKDAINSDNLYIIDMSGVCYILDNIVEEITEYPFEQMDPYQTLECYLDGNVKVLEVTTNSSGKLTGNEILDDIILNFD